MGIPEESLQRLVVLRREIDRIFRDFFDPDRPEVLTQGGPLDLVLDIFETDTEIFIEIELPGVTQDEIELSVLRDVLVIEGAKPRRHSDQGREHICMERTYGRFRRIIEIPGAGDTRSIQAHLADGVLRIRLPKIEDRRGQRRKVAIG